MLVCIIIYICVYIQMVNENHILLICYLYIQYTHNNVLLAIIQVGIQKKVGL